MTTTELDLTGLKCPLPALKTRKALKGLAQGDLLQVCCTDPLAVIDIPNLIRETGDRVEITDRAQDRISDRESRRLSASDRVNRRNWQVGGSDAVDRIVV